MTPIARAGQKPVAALGDGGRALEFVLIQPRGHAFIRRYILAPWRQKPVRADFFAPCREVVTKILIRPVIEKGLTNA